MDMQERIFEETAAGKAAMAKIGEVPDNFRLYQFAWMEERPEDWETMQLTGAEFREAKSGPNKGKLSIKIKGTDKTVYVTKEQISRHADALLNQLQATEGEG